MNLITDIDILEESKDCFLTYSEEVLTDRAIPAAEDGLLSAQRKILWTMEDYLKMNNGSKTKKCNAIVGSTLMTSYFHGDAACYGVLCKMSQPYLMRYPLVTGQGSLGTQENNDMVASSRYTEAKPSKFTDLMMEGFNKKPIPLKETYNGEFMEPVILPALFPNAICNGRQTIAVGISHGSLPHNLSEVCNGIIAYLKNNNISIDELMSYIPGPDFPLGNVIINKNDIKNAFITGKSDKSLKVRGDYEIKGYDIIFTSIPYRTYRNKIKEQLNNNIDTFEKFLDDFDDESSEGNNKLVFHAKPGCVAQLLNSLFELTDLQSSVSYNMNYIVNGTPKLCSLKQLIEAYVTHQNNVIINIAKYDKEKAEYRIHILEGLLIALKDIDKAIELIRNSIDKEQAKKSLINHFNIDEIQANAILDMKLSKLTKLDNDELIKELEEKRIIVKTCNLLINDKDYRTNHLIKLIEEMKNKYGDKRRTTLSQLETPKGEDKEIAYVAPEECVVIMSAGGSVKKIPKSSFKAQNRGGKGVKTQDDITLAAIRTNSIDNLLIFSDKGKLYRLLVDKIPTGTNTSKGVPVGTLIKMPDNESVAAIYSQYRGTDAKYLFIATKNGQIKKTALTEFATSKGNGSACIKLREDDDIAAVSLMNDEQLLLITEQGMIIRINSDITPTGKTAMGVKGISLKEGDKVAMALPIRDQGDDLAVFSTKGLGKRVALNEFTTQGRGGKGVIVYKPTPESGTIAAAQLVNDNDVILAIGDKTSICINGSAMSKSGRTAAGTLIIKGGAIQKVTKV